MTEILEDESDYPPARVLVVDDQPANLLAMEALLETLGHEVVTVSSGKEALRAVAADEFAVILMDVHMPVLDGFETVARIRREHPTAQTPVVFISAVYDQAAHVQRGYALGAVDYLPRPTDPDLLRAKVASFISLYRRGKELERRARIIEEQTAAAKRAEAQNRLKDVYLAVIGHDLRTPLSVIGMVGAQLKREPDPDTVRTLGDRLERVVRRCDSIVGNLLDFTRGELGDGISINPTPTDLGDIARSVVHETSLLHPDREVHLRLCGDLAGAWDVHRVEQVLTNLLQNAIHHGTGAVSVAVGESANGVTIEVHNHGAIPRELLPRIFEPFRRGQPKSDGLGLGLYIVREIMRAHGGSVEVRSSETEGTTFTSVWQRDPRVGRRTLPGAAKTVAADAPEIAATPEE